MFEYVNTSVPNGLLPGTHGFCGVAMTRDLPEPVRRRLESFSSYTHLAPANGPDYLRLNPISWSHFVLDGGEHVLGCVRAAPFDYTGRTNRLARFWFFQPAEVPAGLNPADAILQGGNSASLSDAWSGEPRWLAPRTSSPLSFVAPRTDVRPAAWMQTFGDADGPRLAAAFSVLLAERIRVKGRPLIFLAAPAAHGDGSLLLSLFADLIALLPPPLRAKATFSTYPVALSTSMACHLRGEFGDATRLLAGETAWIDLRARRVHGAETAAIPPELLYLATHGHEQPPEPVIRGGSRRPIPLVRPTTTASPVGQGPTPRIAHNTKSAIAHPTPRIIVSKKKKAGFEDYLLWALGGAFVLGCIVLAFVLLDLKSSKPAFETIPAETKEPAPATTKPDKPKPAPKPKEGKPSVAEPTAPTNAPVAKAEPKPEPKPEPIQPKPEEESPLLLAKTITVVKSFDADAIRKSEKIKKGREMKLDNWTWVYYEQGSSVVSIRPVEINKFGLNDPNPKGIKQFAVLLLDSKSGTCFWKWHLPAPKKPFESADTIDLRRECFGPDMHLFETWKRCHPSTPETYRYRITRESASGDSMTCDCRGPALTIASVLEASKGNLPKLEEELQAATEELKAAQNAFKTAESAYLASSNEVARADNVVNQRESELNNLKNKPKKEQERIKDYKAQEDAKRQAVTEAQNTLFSRQSDKTNKENDLNDAKEKRDKAQEKKEKLEKQVTDMKASSEPRVRAATFEIFPPEFPQ